MSDKNLTFSEIAERHNQAYAAFRTVYAMKNPPPEKPRVARDRTALIIVLALIVVLLASTIVSASRTIVEFGHVGVAAFIMLEGGIIAYAFFRARRSADKDHAKRHVESARAWATGGLGLAFLSALAANINNTLRTHGIVLPPDVAPVVDLIINLLVAVSAPTLAFISGDVLAIELMAGDTKHRQAAEEYDALYQQWLEKLNASWAAQQGRWGVSIKVSNPATEISSGNSNGNLLEGGFSNGNSNGNSTGNSLEKFSNGNAIGNSIGNSLEKFSIGNSRVPDASSLVREFFQAHPEALERSPVEVARELGVGKSTVYNVRKEFNQ